MSHQNGGGRISVKDNAQTVAATMIGAVVGGLAGYMFFTEQGRAWRRQLEPQIDDLMRELNEFRATVAKASNAASEGWRMINEAIQDPQAPRAAASESAPYARSSQAHPF
jgi:gas vesicle protein